MRPAPGVPPSDMAVPLGVVVVAGEIIYLVVARVAGRDTNKHRLILVIPFIL